MPYGSQKEEQSCKTSEVLGEADVSLEKIFPHRSFGYALKKVFHNLTPLFDSETV